MQKVTREGDHALRVTAFGFNRDRHDLEAGRSHLSAMHPRAEMWRPPSFNRSLRHWRARVLALSARNLFEPPQGLDVTVEI
jgi:hypothetical protein